MGMRTAGNLPFVELKYFVLSHQSWYIQMYKKNPRAHAHIRLHHWRASPLQRLQSARKANSRRRQIRRGAWALHQRKRKHTGRTFNLSQAFQTEHPKGDEMTLMAVVTSQKQNTDCCPRCFCPRCNRG